MIAEGGGSLGIGQELAWSCALQLPTLIVHREDTYVSRQAKGAAEEHDVEIQTYGGPDHLEDVVRLWLVSRRVTICDGPRRRIGRNLHYGGCHERLAQAWAAFSAEEKEHVVAVTRISQGRIERLLAEPLALPAASVQEFVTLCAALRIDVPGMRFAEPPPTLRPRQIAALNSAAKEFNWDFEKALRIHNQARRELAGWRGATAPACHEQRLGGIR